MNLQKVLFLGGSGSYASVQVRCVDIASRLGCDYLIGGYNIQEIPDKYSAFVCIKPYLLPGLPEALASRGKIIWDIIDEPPLPKYVSVYIASTKIAKDLFSHIGRIVIIPHHHCNFGGKPNPSNLRKPAWIGSSHWLPTLAGFKYDVYPVQGMTRQDVVKAHRRIGIGLNFRNKNAFFEQAWPSLEQLARTVKERRRMERNMYNFHLAVNSGIKLINCIGFGTPSISGDEPAYHEIGEECTIFTNTRHCARWVKELKNDADLYLDLRKRCLRKASKYHIDVIVEKYRTLLKSL